jgi:hypothetical protein
MVSFLIFMLVLTACSGIKFKERVYWQAEGRIPSASQDRATPFFAGRTDEGLGEISNWKNLVSVAAGNDTYRWING